MNGPLTGIQILAAEQMHALPHATQLLGMMGAEVIKVEPLGGESGRAGSLAIDDVDGGRTGSTFIRNNLGKASIALDLKSDEGRDLFLQLAATVDVVAENFRPGTADKLGVGYAQVHDRNPAAIYVSISGFGNDQDPASPYRDWAAYAPIVEGMAGLFEYSHAPDEPPRMAVAGALGDTGPGLYAVIGVLAALHERARTGKGAYVDISMYDAMVAIADIVHPASMGVEPSRVLDGVGILHAFRAKDGWFTVEVVREAHFPHFAEAVEHPEWCNDPRLATRAGWGAHLESVIRPAVEEWAAPLSKLEAAEKLARHGVAAGPVNDAASILSDPHVQARNFIHHPVEGSDLAVVGNPIAFRSIHTDAQPNPERPSRWPTLGQDTERILRERLGLAPEAIAELQEQGRIA